MTTELMSTAVRERPDEVAHVLTSLSQLLVVEDVGTALKGVVELARRTIPGCTAAGVTLLDGDEARTASYTDERTLKVDAAQYERGDGPCLEAARTARPVRVSVDEAEERWPDFTAAARDAGVQSFLAAPLMAAGGSVGALNLYSDEPDGFAELDEAFTSIFTAQIGATLLSVSRYADAARLAEQLRTALTSRQVLDQAKGILMAQQGIEAEAAWSQLVQRSQHANRKVRDVAADVVETVTGSRPVVTAQVTAVGAQGTPRDGRPAGARADVTDRTA